MMRTLRGGGEPVVGQQGQKARRRRLAARTVLVGGIVAIGIYVLCALALGLYRAPQPDPSRRWDAIVVLGCRVDPTGQPSPTLRRRTERAVALWRQGLAPRIVFSGGVGTFPPSEAAAAARHARRLHVAPQAIRLEETSTSTRENARHVAALGQAGARVMIVTDDYHLLRARRVFAHHFEEVGTAGVGIRPRHWYLASAREILALGYYGLRGWL